MSVLSSSPGLALCAGFLFQHLLLSFVHGTEFYCQGLFGRMSGGQWRVQGLGALAEGLGAGSHRRICDS